jgi:hypothetical protein
MLDAQQVAQEFAHGVFFGCINRLGKAALPGFKAIAERRLATDQGRISAQKQTVA